MTEDKHPRRLEIDLLRTLAIVAMVTYHVCYDLSHFYHWNIDLFSPSWKYFERLTASLFLLLVGISFALSQKRVREDKTVSYRKYQKRGLWLLGWAYAVSIATYVFDPSSYVRFGILHLIGIGVLILPFFTKFGLRNLAIAVAIFTASYLTNDIRLPTESLLPLGIRPTFFETVDYFPLLPWFAVILLGYVIGDWIYVKHSPASMPENRFLRYCAWLGKYSLVIYVAHQPLILLFLRLILGERR